MLVVTGLHFLLLALLGLSRHWSYLTSITDLGVYDQSVWGILHGRPFIITSQPFAESLSHLSIHFNPIIAGFAPAYVLFPAAEWLIVGHAAALSATALPLYLLGRRILGKEWAAFLWALTYLLNPFVLSTAVWDFKPAALAAPIVAFTLLAIEIGAAKRFLFCCCLLLLTREHLGVAVMGFGALWWIRNRQVGPAVGAILLGGLGFGLIVGVIMPAFSPTESHLMMSEDFGQLSRYGWLGTSLGDVVVGLLRHPWEVVGVIFAEFGGWRYVFWLLLPFSFLPLLAMTYLLPAAADLSANLLSSNPMPRSILSYHSVSLIPLLVVASMVAARRLSRHRRYNVLGLARLCLVPTVITAVYLAPIPSPGSMNVWKPANVRIWPERGLREVKRLIPPDANVVAQTNVAAHFSQRAIIRPFPHGLTAADMVVLHLASPTERVGEQDPAEIGSLAHHLQMNPGEFLRAVEDLLADDTFGLLVASPTWLVLKRGQATTPEALEIVAARLDRLHEDWLVQD